MLDLPRRHVAREAIGKARPGMTTQNMSASIARLASSGLRTTSRHSNIPPHHARTTAKKTIPQSTAMFYSTGKPTQGPHQPPKHEQPEMVPKANFKEMFQGASPLVKGVVYTMVGVIATIETYTYSLWVWHYFYPKPAADSENGVDVVVEKVGPKH
jgi:hypothetical protein